MNVHKYRPTHVVLRSKAPNFLVNQTFLTMVSSPSVQFIDTALFSTSPFELSYTNPDQKLLIRQQLIQLVQEFPTLHPSMDIFTHNDGTTVYLLTARGALHISHSSPPIPIQIWLHESFPLLAPMVLISSNIPGYPIYHDHPFVDSSGEVASPYLIMWDNSRCSLSSLVHNLIKLFFHNHPFYRANHSSSTHPSLVSKLEAMDRLTCTLHYDMTQLREKTRDEIEELSALQAEMFNRADMTTSIIIGLEEERANLKGRVRELTEHADVLVNWLRVHDKSSNAIIMAKNQIEDMFEVVGENSKLVLDGNAEDLAIEDLMDAFYKAVEKGAFTFEVYIRQVRSLAREQFFVRNRLVQLNGTQIIS